MELERRKEDLYQMGLLTAKVDHLSDALKSHMIREEEVTRDFRADIRKINKYIYILLAATVFQAPTSVSEVIKLFI